MLYIVATPIGNLEDITLRALRVLREADLVLCEDTRVTRRLLDHYEIKTPTFSYHQHSAAPKVDKIIELLKEGKTLALVTDAGTPGISDPGNKLIDSVTRILPQTAIIPIPGASAVATALSIAGVPTDEFVFLGFLPHKKGRQTAVKEIVASKRTVVLYESVHRIEKLLRELCTAGAQNRSIVVCRELTKMFETMYRGTIQEAAGLLAEKPQEIKGEFVVVIGAL